MPSGEIDDCVTAARPAPARGGGGGIIDEYVRALERGLTGPTRLKSDMLAEARHGLEDAAEANREEGLDSRAAQALAVAEFGALAALRPAYQAELAVAAARRLAARFALATLATAAGSTLMWRGAPWTGPRPPTWYLVLSDGLDWLGHAVTGVAVLAVLGLGWAARRPGGTRTGWCAGWRSAPTRHWPRWDWAAWPSTRCRCGSGRGGHLAADAAGRRAADVAVRVVGPLCGALFGRRAIAAGHASRAARPRLTCARRPLRRRPRSGSTARGRVTPFTPGRGAARCQGSDQRSR